MRISPSSISLYRECPLRYRFISLDKLKPAPKPFFSFGNAIHKSLYYLYADSLFSLPPLTDLLLFYHNNWNHQGYSNSKEETEYYRLGLSILSNFYKKEVKNGSRPVAVEYRFNVAFDKFTLFGFIDRIDKTDGGYEIIDYKTSKKPPSLDSLKRNHQLAIYQMGVEGNLGFKVARLSILHLRSLSKISIPAHKPESLKKVLEEISEIVQKIEEGEFEPKLHNGCPCEFDDRCPYFREKYQENNIAEVVDEYGILKERIKTDEKRVKELYRIINEYLDKKGIRQAFGKDFSVTLSLVRGSKLKADIKRIIEDNDLWDEVQSWLKECGYEVEEEEETKRRLNVRRRDV